MPRSWRSQYQRFSDATRAVILRRAHGRCQIRGPRCQGIATVADHIIPDAEGGTNDASNGQAACDPCHEDKTKQERVRGMKRRSRYREPMQHPGVR